MSDTALLLLLVALNLLFASALAGVRLRAIGWSARRIWVITGEMWAVFGLMIAMFRYLLWKAGDTAVTGAGPAGEFSGFAARFATLPAGAKATFVGGLVLTAGLFFHMLITLNRGMHKAPPES